MRRSTSLCMLAVVGLLFGIFGVPTASASLIGTVPTAPGSTVVPGLVPPGTFPGTLLASLSAPFASTLGTDSGTLISAVYAESGGTLDFYYQLLNNPTGAKCGGAGQVACNPLSRLTDSSFDSVATSLGFRTDTGGPFVVGSVAPTTGDRNPGGDVVGFNFGPPESSKIAPGTNSDILVISTDATTFSSGNASVIDGGVATVASFAPAPVPEPGSILLLASGMLGMFAMRRPRR